MRCRGEMYVGHDEHMLKQAGGFSLFGAVAAALGTALGMSTLHSGGYSAYVAGMSFVNDGVEARGWSVLFLAVLAGVFVGAITGVGLYAGGVRIHAGAGNRVGRVVSAGLAGTLLGLSPALVVVGRSFVGLDVGRAVIEWLLLLYAACAVLAYLGALAAVHIVLRASGAEQPRRTVTAVAGALPVGAMLATATGMGVAWMLGYTTSPYTVVAVCISVVVVLAATFAVACSREDGGRSRTGVGR